MQCRHALACALASTGLHLPCPHHVMLPCVVVRSPSNPLCVDTTSNRIVVRLSGCMLFLQTACSTGPTTNSSICDMCMGHVSVCCSCAGLLAMLTKALQVHLSRFASKCSGTINTMVCLVAATHFSNAEYVTLLLAGQGIMRGCRT